jgi:hypothetical protein
MNYTRAAREEAGDRLAAFSAPQPGRLLCTSSTFAANAPYRKQPARECTATLGPSELYAIGDQAVHGKPGPEGCPGP